MKNDRVYIRHILDAIDKVDEYIQVGYDDFMAHSHWQDVVIHDYMGVAHQGLVCSDPESFFQTQN